MVDAIPPLDFVPVMQRHASPSPCSATPDPLEAFQQAGGKTVKDTEEVVRRESNTTSHHFVNYTPFKQTFTILPPGRAPRRMLAHERPLLVEHHRPDAHDCDRHRRRNHARLSSLWRDADQSRRPGLVSRVRLLPAARREEGTGTG